ncbi:hypothetical protein DXG03_001483, partial [Asterophora parasitica]
MSNIAGSTGATTAGTAPRAPLSNDVAGQIVTVMQRTLGGLDTTLNKLNEQSRVFNEGVRPQMDKTSQIEDLQKRLNEHSKAQRRLVRAAKKTIREDFKNTVSDRLRDDISAQIRREVEIQVKDQVELQIGDHIPVPLELQAIDNNRQIAEIKAALANSEARAKNSHLQGRNLDEPLAPVLKPDGNKSQVFPADLRSLFCYDLDMSNVLMKDFGLEEEDSLSANYGRFMRHIGSFQ